MSRKGGVLVNKHFLDYCESMAKNIINKQITIKCNGDE